MGFAVDLFDGNYAQRQAEETWKKLKENHDKWATNFAQAEANRRKEEREWREFYAEVYGEETSTWKTYVMLALNGIQLWALYTQYKQQKEIADRTYDLANRQQTIAEELYSIYKSVYQPHETAFGKQIDNYFAKPYEPQTDITAGRFVVNARMAMLGKRREVLMCASQYCTGAVTQSLKDLVVQEANLVGNAANSAYKYEQLRKDKMDDKWVNIRLAFVRMGRGLSASGTKGIAEAFEAFHSFGADPGAALSRLLGTIAYTVGGIIPNPYERGPAPVEEAKPAWQRPSTPNAVRGKVIGG